MSHGIRVGPEARIDARDQIITQQAVQAAELQAVILTLSDQVDQLNERLAIIAADTPISENEYDPHRDDADAVARIMAGLQAVPDGD
jgi:hypothetical protein